MKKILSLIVVLGFVIGMAACGPKQVDEVEEQMDPEEMEMMEAEEPEVEEPVAEEPVAEAAPAQTAPKKTTVQKAVEVVEEVKEEAPKKRGGGTSGN
jgi:hypothetical protein